MKNGLIGLDFLLYCTNKINFHAFEKNNRRYLTISLLLLFSATFTLIKGQTVNYTYDISGNVVSKTVIQPQENARFSIENDSIQLFNSLLADNQIQDYTESEPLLTTQGDEPVETLECSANAASSKKEVPATSSLPANTEWSRIVMETENTNGHNY